MQDEGALEAAGDRDYGRLGERIAGILKAAEDAAAGISGDAAREAAELRRRAQAEAEALVFERRREAEADAERLLSQAASDAAAIRDAVYAAAERIGDEGHRTLEQLRLEARALEERFEAAVDGLRELVAQLEDVVLAAARQAPSPSSDADGRGEVDERGPSTPAEPRLEQDLTARAARDSSFP
ncbi:MAG: hypothetical protein ICV74_07590 [Thermoleophilia bacterium]|nr:hypothetical protein [Thermoleophilia bacterium]